jgi:guanine deaminase
MKRSEIERYMLMAVEEAEKGMRKMDGGPFGAVIVRDGEVLAAAHNEVVGSNDPTAHAEIVAIRKACSRLGSFNLEGSILFATGEPCPMCFSAIHWAHIERVYYCNSKDDAADIGFDDTFISEIIEGRRPDPIPFIREKSDRCGRLLKLWSENPQKVPY